MPSSDVSTVQLLIAAAVALALALGVQTLRLWLFSRRRSWRARQRTELGTDGERRALGMLSRRGYVVVAEQPRALWVVLADGEPHSIRLRADLIVERDGARFVADVKAGELVASVSHGPTRRQLLEYYCAYDVDGVLLVDASRDRVLEVRFPAAIP